MSIEKAQVRAVVSSLLAKALVAVVQLIKTRLLPKATERYCKSLQKFADKLIGAINKSVDKVGAITDSKKLIRELFVLDLAAITMENVGKALLTSAEHIKSAVNFAPLHAESETKTELIALATAEDDEEDFGCCGPDGCEIA